MDLSGHPAGSEEQYMEGSHTLAAENDPILSFKDGLNRERAFIGAEMLKRIARISWDGLLLGSSLERGSFHRGASDWMPCT
jgi:hypothetical protein